MRGRRVYAGAICTFLLALSAPVFAQSVQQGNEIRAALRDAQGKLRGCTAVRKKFRRLEKRYPAYTFVFAGRQDETSFTGIRGCGYAWNPDPDEALRRAMAHCRKQEVEKGTAGGTRTCKVMR